MSTFAARRLGQMAENTRGVIAIELLAAAQGIDFRRPLKSSPALEQAHALLRSKVAFYDHDRHFAPDIEAAKAVIRRNTNEVQGGGNFELFDELFADDFVDHTPQPGRTPPFWVGQFGSRLVAMSFAPATIIRTAASTNSRLNVRPSPTTT